MTPLAATVSRKCVGVGGCGGGVVTNAFHSKNACWYMRALNNNGTEHIGSIRVNTDRGVNTDRWLTIHMSKNPGL